MLPRQTRSALLVDWRNLDSNLGKYARLSIAEVECQTTLLTNESDSVVRRLSDRHSSKSE